MTPPPSPSLGRRYPSGSATGGSPSSRTRRASSADLVSVLHAWQGKFSEIEPRVAAILQRDYDARAADARPLAPADLIEPTTGGLRYVAEPRVSRVILAPSYFARPYNFLIQPRRWRLFGYPVADSALDPTDALSRPRRSCGSTGRSATSRGSGS